MVTSTGNRWRESMREPDGSYSRRTHDSVENALWKETVPRFGVHRPDPFSVPVLNALRDLLSDYMNPETILEIGPGWGNYTMWLASICHELICVDISEDVLDYIENSAADRGYRNITKIASSWEDCPDVKCDILFGYNIFYRAIHIEDMLMKMNNTADKLCVIGTHQVPDQPYKPVLEQELKLMMHYTRVDYKDLYAILLELGIEAHLVEIPNRRTYTYEHFDQLYNRAISNIRGPFNPDEVCEVLHRFYKLEDGHYTCDYPFVSGLIYWEPKRHIITT